MATQYVNRESINTKSRHVTPTYMDKDEGQRVVGSSDPMPIIDVNHLRLHEGRAYYVYKLYPYAAGLGAGASINIAIAWPAGVFPMLSLPTRVPENQSSLCTNLRLLAAVRP